MSLKPKRVNFNETWSVIQATIQDVITLRHVPRSAWNDRFSDVYSLCVAYPEPLADRLYKETKQFLHDHVSKLLVKVQKSSEEELLPCYRNTWIEYSIGVKYLQCLFLYLNVQHIQKQKLSDAEIIYGNLLQDEPEQMEIGELGLDMWKQNMITPLKDILVHLLLNGIINFQMGDDNNIKHVYRGVVQSFVSVQEYKKRNNLKLYEDIFEKPYLETCGERYKVEASRLLQECNVGQYLENVWQRLEEERQRCSMFLHDSSLPKVRARFVQHMVTDHLAFLHGECRTMVQQEQCKNLRTMYLLLRLVDNGISVLVSELLEHIKAKGLEAVAGLKGENVYMQFIENSLAVYDKYRGIINDVFDHDQSLLGSLDKACSFVINHRQVPKQPCRSPEMLAKYCDTLLKKSSKGLSESEMEEKLTKSIIIFKYIDDKDVFQKFYSRMLAKRLIHQQSQSLDAEEAMINKLKQACGYEFTNKLHRMFTDITVSSDLNNKFSEFLKKDRTELGIHFFIHVLQAGAWPLGQAALTPFSLPLELEKSVQMFENFYYNHFSGRKLTWLHHLCQGEVKLNYLKKHYMITMQTFQMAILLQFEKSNSLSYSELQESTQLNSEQFSRHIASLVDSKLITCENESQARENLQDSGIENLGNGKLKVSLKPVEQKVPDETSVFSLNLNYSNKRTKLRITAALQRESPQEVEQTRSSVDEDRKLYLQAAVVRIMKSRKVLKHNALIQEILSQSQVSFAPTINMIKKSIESLIDKQYIERTPNSADEYSYVA